MKPSHLGLALAAGALAGCASDASPGPSSDPLDPFTLEQTGTSWSDAFSAAVPSGAAGIAPVARTYLAQVSPAQGDQLAELLGDTTFTIPGMRQALASSDNQLGNYDEALDQLAHLAEDSPQAMPPSLLAFDRALNAVGIDARLGVLVQDHGKLDQLVVQLLLLAPAQTDAWSDMYGYQLGVALYLDGRFDAAVDQLAPVIAANRTGGGGKLDADTVGSALNITVHALRMTGDETRAETYATETIAYDDAHHLNYAGRFGESTHLGSK